MYKIKYNIIIKSYEILNEFKKEMTVKLSHIYRKNDVGKLRFLLV